MAKKQVTIKEIAKLSGVSVSTVSRVINNNPSVNPEKRKKIQEVINQVGFQPSMLARGMVSKETHTFAVIVPDITNPYFTSLIYEIEQYSKTKGYSLLLVNTMTAGKNKESDSSSFEINNFKVIKEKQVDGVIILGGEIDKVHVDSQYIQAINRLNKDIPVIIIGQHHEGVECCFIERNLRKGVIQLTHHLLALGHRRIAFIGGEPGVKITEERLSAFKETLSIYSSVKDEYIVLTDYYMKDGYDAMRQLIGQDEEMPTAVIAINDNVALGAIRAAADANIRCPQDIKIVSCDYFLNSEYTIPRLTTIDQHNEYLGQFAVKKLIDIIHEEDQNEQFYHEPELIIRESCGTYLREENECI